MSNLIELTIIDAFEVPADKNHKGPINVVTNHIIPNIRENTKLIVYPLLDMESGAFLVNLSVLEAINQIKAKYKQIHSFLDCQGGLNTFITDLQ